MFYSLIEQNLSVQILQNFFLYKNIPNAILISGVEGTGKKQAAITFAMLCNCNHHSHANLKEKNLTEKNTPTEPCGVCNSCRKILSNIHPDIFIIEPSGKFIIISQIRSMVTTLTKKPYEAKKRFIIIYNAHQMTTESANALLKSLEEPPNSTIIILISDKISTLLPTTVSRCHQVRFNPISKQAILDILITVHHISSATAKIAASISQGNLKEALKFVNADKGRKNWIGMRNRLLSELTDLILNTERPLSYAFAIAERISKEKEHIPFFLKIIKTYLRDLIIVKYNLEKNSRIKILSDTSNLINQDKIEIIWQISQKISLKTLQKYMKETETAEKNINFNSNLKLTMESLILNFSNPSFRI